MREKRYGVPYQGSKSRIAEDIINILPKGKRLVNLFGGGGAISHCALLSNKYDYVLYNDINLLISELFQKAVSGELSKETRIIGRDEFELLKDTDGCVKYIWSFGNDGESYLWGKDIEEIKLQACRMVMGNSLNERLKEYRKFIRMLESLERLQSLGRLQITNMDYRNYLYADGDVVYCDIPYENVKQYDTKFDNKKFYEWVKKQKYQVFFSSYDIDDKDFYKHKVKEIASLQGSTTNSKKVTEYLYSNMEFETKGEQLSMIV